MRHALLSLGLALIFPMTRLHAQSPNTTVIDPDGTVHLTRTLPIPPSLSPQAQAVLKHNGPEVHYDLPQRRIHTDEWQTGAGKKSLALYPVHIADAVIAHVPVRDVTPLTQADPTRVLICLHGGGFNTDSGSFTESIPIANLTHMRVVAVLYRLAPEHPYPAALEDAIAVYQELLKTYQPAHIAIYGTSAGAILTAQVAVRLKQLKLPQPAALGIFSGMGDFTAPTESSALYTGSGLHGSPPIPSADTPRDTSYTGTHDPHDPVISPLFADLQGLPPTLFLSSSRDMLLSGTTILHRAFLRAGVDARLIIFEGLAHAFWNDVDLPETTETYHAIATFMTQQLKR